MNTAPLHRLRAVWLKFAALLVLGVAGLNAQTTYTPVAAYSDREQQAFGDYTVDREGYLEFSFLFRNFSAPSLTVPQIEIPTVGIYDATMQIKDTMLYGISFAYNPDLHFSVSFDISYGRPEYDAIWGTDIIRGEGTMWITNLNVEYNFLEGKFSPFVGGGIGLLSFDSGVPNGGGIYYWWDPYWGYVAGTSYTTHNSKHWTWSGAVGVRWDFADSWTAKATYQMIWSKIGNAGTEAFPQYTVSIGWRWY